MAFAVCNSKASRQTDNMNYGFPLFGILVCARPQGLETAITHCIRKTTAWTGVYVTVLRSTCCKADSFVRFPGQKKKPHCHSTSSRLDWHTSKTKRWLPSLRGLDTSEGTTHAAGTSPLRRTTYVPLPSASQQLPILPIEPQTPSPPPPNPPMYINSKPYYAVLSCSKPALVILS